MNLLQPEVVIDRAGGPPKKLLICHKYGCYPPNRVSTRIPASTWTRLIEAATDLTTDVDTAAAERLFIAWFAGVLERVVALGNGWFKLEDGLAATSKWSWACTRPSCGPLRKRIAAVEARLGLTSAPPNGARWNEIGRDDVDNESGKPGGMDCIDNAINAATYLELMCQLGLLQYHRVAQQRRYSKQFVWRALIIPWGHYGAVFVEIADGMEWVLDLWDGTTGTPGMIVRRSVFETPREFYADDAPVYAHLRE